MADEKEVSKQPRFEEVDGVKASTFFESTLKWQAGEWENAPDLKIDSRKRDSWLANFWKAEPHLAGIVMGAVSIDVNRGWTLTGGRNQVLRFSPVLHGWRGFPDVYGYRTGTSLAATAYYTGDLGAVIELGRDSPLGPVRALYHVDHTRCRVTNNPNYPLAYYPKGAKMQAWTFSDYMRIGSMPSGLEDLGGLGYCAVSRARELAQLMLAVYQHDKESLGAKAPRGLLLIQGIDESQFDSAMEIRKAKSDSEGWKYFSSVAVLASDTDIDAKLLALSNLPANFDMEQFTSLLIYGYALCFGYDASEFYPVRYGGLSRSAESEIQHTKASGKGGKNYVFGFQDALSRPDVFPPTLLFEIDERDDDGEMSAATVVKTWTDAFQAMRTAGDLTGEHVRILLAEKGYIPESWTEYEEDVIATDIEGTPDNSDDPEIEEDETEVEETDETEETETERTITRFKLRQESKRRKRDRLLSNPRIMRAAERFENESIVSFHYPENKVRVLWESGASLLRRQSYPVVKRQDSDVLFEDEESDIEITESDVDRAIASAENKTPEFAELLDPEPFESEESE